MASRFLAPFFALALQGAVPAAFAQPMALALAGGTTVYGYEYAPPAVHVAGGIATVSGLVRTPACAQIAVLPAGARPTMRMIFTVWTGTSASAGRAAARVDVLPDGRIVCVMGGPGTTGWISLDGIRFPIESFHPGTR